jgi:hypothetical protein
MSCAGDIRAHIGSCGDEVFSTSEFLNYGLRNAVDQALFRLVKQGLIERVARGVFRRPCRIAPEVIAVARCKASAFKKRISTDGFDLAREFGLIDEGHPLPTFATCGPNSSFVVGVETVVFKAVSRRRMALPDDAVGRLLCALWAVGPNGCAARQIWQVAQRFEKADILRLLNSAHLVPGWLNSSISAAFA